MDNQTKVRVVRHKQRTYPIFQNWRQKPIYCPALNKKVGITLKGWQHINGEGKWRNFRDIHRRLNYFENAKRLIEISTTYQDVDASKDGLIIYTLQAVVRVRNEDQTRRGMRLFVVIEDNQYTGKANFFSVYAQNIRTIKELNNTV